MAFIKLGCFWKVWNVLSQSSITLSGRMEESIVGRHFPGRLPDALDGIEFRRIGWQSVQLDRVLVFFQPGFSFVIKPMPRAIVDD